MKKIFPNIYFHSTFHKYILSLILIVCVPLLSAFSQDPNESSEETFSREPGSTESVTVVLPFQTNATTVQVERIRDTLVLEGDIVLGENSLAIPGRQGAAISGSSFRWSSSTVPYVLRPDHPKKREILRAMTHIRDNTNICFKPRTDEDDFIVFLKDNGCWSYIGKQGGRQPVNLGSGCSYGNAVHELCHALGLFHEQSRADRDSNVTINWSNIISGKSHNFQKYSVSYTGSDIGSYDYGSIMHYGARAFGKRSCRTCPKAVTIVPTSSGVSIGQRRALSAGDINTINTIYSTAATCGTGSLAAEGNDTFWGDVKDFLGIEDEAGQSDDTSGANGTSAASISGNSIDIWYDVELVPQLTGVSCWAAGAAMVVGWRDWVSINPSDIASGTGYWGQYYNSGLPPDDTAMFNAWGLYTEPPQSYTVEGFAEILDSYGPLWVASAEPLSGPNAQNAHIRVVVGMLGDGTPEGTMVMINDPWEQGMTRFRPPNRGSTYRETYMEFMRKQHNLASSEMDIDQPVYLAHP